jgi:hypothetical protein
MDDFTAGRRDRELPRESTPQRRLPSGKRFRTTTDSHRRCERRARCPGLGNGLEIRPYAGG